MRLAFFIISRCFFVCLLSNISMNANAQSVNVDTALISNKKLQRTFYGQASFYADKWRHLRSKENDSRL
jgi:hypothetical protein